LPLDVDAKSLPIVIPILPPEGIVLCEPSEDAANLDWVDSKVFRSIEQALRTLIHNVEHLG